MALPVASYLVVSNVSEHKTWSAQYCALRARIRASPPSFNAFRYARQFEFLESRWFLCKVKANLRRYSSQRASGKKEPKQTIGETF